MRTKRVEYDKGLFVTDERLEVEIISTAKEFVNDILDGVGKEYAIAYCERHAVGLDIYWYDVEYVDSEVEE